VTGEGVGDGEQIRLAKPLGDRLEQHGPPITAPALDGRRDARRPQVGPQRGILDP
jgi:hypothetical protein